LLEFRFSIVPQKYKFIKLL